ncbi:MAG: hypothetical protein IPP87_23215 [Ideonella sp.]|nr:hypothetical protein [Ideonella sp.]
MFPIAVADRLAHDRFDGPTRVAFTTALVQRVADTLRGNEIDMMGEPPPGQPQPRDRFIDLFNELHEHYGEFGGEAGTPEFTPDFAFLRYLGRRLEPTLPPRTNAGCSTGDGGGGARRRGVGAAHAARPVLHRAAAHAALVGRCGLNRSGLR